jgi:hypothetical protein
MISINIEIQLMQGKTYWKPTNINFCHDKLYIVHTVHFHLIPHFLNQQNAHFLLYNITSFYSEIIWFYWFYCKKKLYCIIDNKCAFCWFKKCSVTIF